MPTALRASDKAVLENPFRRDCARSRTSTRISTPAVCNVPIKWLSCADSYPIVESMMISLPPKLSVSVKESTSERNPEPPHNPMTRFLRPRKRVSRGQASRRVTELERGRVWFEALLRDVQPLTLAARRSAASHPFPLPFERGEGRGRRPREWAAFEGEGLVSPSASGEGK